MMKSNEILYSAGNNDECYTPCYGVEPILKYIPSGKIIWCPFDTEESNFVKMIREAGHEVVQSHISEGKDFYLYEPENWDIMISNPPFTNKRKIFERALELGKPFALLMTLTWLNDSAPKQLFMDKELELIMFDKRIEFQGDKKITFSSAYYCHGFLPKQIIMENINKHA